MKLISLDELKEFLEKTDTEHDTILERFIEQVGVRFESYTGRRFTEAARTEKFDGGKRLYYMDAFPIDTGQTLTVKEDDVTMVVDLDYFIKATSGLIEFTGKTSEAKPNIIEVTWTGGYSTTDEVLDVPDDLKMVCTLQCAFQFKRRKEPGLRSVSTPDGAINSYAPNTLLPEVERVLRTYKVVRL